MNRKEKNYERSEIQILIQEVYIEYKAVFKKYRKETTHFSKDGKYVEWIKNDYERWGNLIWKVKEKNGLFYNLFNYDSDYEDEFEDDFNSDYKDSWFHRQFQETAYKNGIKRSVQEKLFTDKKLTFEEYTTLLEIITEKFRDSFNCDNGRFDIIFRERSLEERVNTKVEKEKNESEDKDIEQ